MNYLKRKEDIVYMNQTERYKLLHWINDHRSYLNDTQSTIDPDLFIESIYEWSSIAKDPKISDRQMNVLISWYNNILSRQLIDYIILHINQLDDKNEKFYKQYCKDILVNCINKGFCPSDKQWHVLMNADKQIQYANQQDNVNA